MTEGHDLEVSKHIWKEFNTLSMRISPLINKVCAKFIDNLNKVVGVKYLFK